MAEETALATRDEPAPLEHVLRQMETVETIVARQAAVKEAMNRAMVKDVHYGVIPGTGSKPALLKPGAEMLGSLFRLRPEFTHDDVWDGDHLTVTSSCSLFHMESNICLARGVAGICSTKESKYAYRTANRACPKCGKEAIFKSKKAGEGWYCWGKKGGCGAKFDENERAITEQVTGRVPNPDLPDLWNTIIKMADKRSLVAAVLVATGASDMFTQDVDETHAASRGEAVEYGEPAEDAARPSDGAATTTQASATPERGADPANQVGAAIRLVQAIKKHASWRPDTHGVPTRAWGVEKLQKLLDELGGGAKPEAPATPAAPADPRDPKRAEIRAHPNFARAGGEGAYGDVLRDADLDDLEALYAYLGDFKEEAAS